MGEETGGGRASCEHEGDDMEKEGVGEPFDDDLGDADGQTIAHEPVDVCGGTVREK